jgi:hypothetical protein
MFGNTLTLTLGGSGGTDRVLKLINQDSYGAEYLNRNSTDEIRLKIRHFVETPKSGAEPVERHQFYVTQTVFMTDTTPEYIRSSNLAIRGSKTDDATEISDLSEAVALWATETNLESLIAWES